MKLRVLSDEHTVFLYQGPQVKAFVAKTFRGTRWGIVPSGPSGRAAGIESAMHGIIHAIQEGLDERRDGQQVAIPPARKGLHYVGYLTIDEEPESGVREVARRIGAWFARHTGGDARAAYDEHAKTYEPGASKKWHMKAAELALKVGGPVHDNLAWYHFKDGGGKRSGWSVFRARCAA